MRCRSHRSPSASCESPARSRRRRRFCAKTCVASTRRIVCGRRRNLYRQNVSPEVRSVVVDIVQGNPIPSRDLVIGHVPAFDLRMLDPHWDGPSTAQWGELWTFALTFNGYGNTGLSNELWVFANEVRERYANDGELFTLSLFWLRALLFIEQRRASKDAYSVRCSPDKAASLQALLDAIRAEVRRQQVRLIQTKDLREADVPRIDPELREVRAS